MSESDHIYMSVKIAVEDKLHEMNLDDLREEFVKKYAKDIAEDVNDLINDEISSNLKNIQ